MLSSGPRFSVVIDPIFEPEKLEIAATLIAGLRGTSLDKSMSLFELGKPRVIANGVSEERAAQLEHLLSTMGISCEIAEGYYSSTFGGAECALPPGGDLFRPLAEDPGESYDSGATPED